MRPLGESVAESPLIPTGRYWKTESSSHHYQPTLPCYLEPSQDTFRRGHHPRFSRVTRATAFIIENSTSEEEETGSENKRFQHHKPQRDPEVTQLRQQGTAHFDQIDTNLEDQQQALQGQHNQLQYHQ